MKERVFDPRRLDVAAFAAASGVLEGEVPLDSLPRLADSGVLRDAGEIAAVRWQARGRSRPQPGGDAEIVLELQAQAELPLQCQRCLAPVVESLQVQRRFLFARDEAQAERLDEESDDDVLVLTQALDLQELVEDELILALPLVPRHEVCPSPLPQPDAVAADDEAPPREHPFAALAALRRSGEGS